MGNSMYVRGRSFENYVKSLFVKSGFFVMRSAASKGIFDLLVVHKGRAYGIQCKVNGKISRAEKAEMLIAWEKYGIVPLLAWKREGKVVITDMRSGETYLIRGAIEVIRITGEIT